MRVQSAAELRYLLDDKELSAGSRRITGMENALQNRPQSTRVKSPLALAKTALAEAREAIPQYASRFSRHDYTQHQLYALVALRRLLKTDYRGLEATLRDWAELRDALGLVRVPDHSTIQRAEQRFDARRKANPSPARTEAMPLFDRPAPAPAPMSVSAA
jgi:hypothetical protein